MNIASPSHRLQRATEYLPVTAGMNCMSLTLLSMRKMGRDAGVCLSTGNWWSFFSGNCDFQRVQPSFVRKLALSLQNLEQKEGISMNESKMEIWSNFIVNQGEESTSAELSFGGWVVCGGSHFSAGYLPFCSLWKRKCPQKVVGLSGLEHSRLAWDFQF